MALATVVRRTLFTPDERENGKAAWVLGASFITEGAIPFAAADPLRVIPANIVGSMTAGGLVMAFGSTLRAPHGGIWVLPLIGSPFLYLSRSWRARWSPRRWWCCSRGCGSPPPRRLWPPPSPGSSRPPSDPARREVRPG